MTTNRRACPGPNVARFLEDVTPFIKTEQEQTRWPGGGTLIPGYSCTVTYIHVSDASLALLQRAASALDWVHPNFPEDLTFYRSDGSEFFVVIGHERIAYFHADQTERENIEDALPKVVFSSVGSIRLMRDSDE